MTLLLALAVLLAQEGPSRVTVHEELLREEYYLDLDSATSLSRPELGAAKADVRLRMRGRSYLLEPAHGARLRSLAFQTLDRFEEELKTDGSSEDPLELDKPCGLVGKTSEGLVFKAAVYMFGSEPSFVFLEYAIQRNGAALFPARVRGLTAEGADGTVRVSWSGGGDYRVRWFRGSKEEGSRDVRGEGAEIRGLAKDAVYRIQVARRIPNGGEGEPDETATLASAAGAEYRTIRLPRPIGHGYAVNLRTGTSDEGDPDWMPYFWGMKTPVGGGIVHLGEGAGLFEGTFELPRFGYAPWYDRFDGNHVYGIRLRDGRFAKVHILPGRDVRDELVAEVVLFRGGGRVLRPGPAGLTARFTEGEVDLAWKADPGIVEFSVHRIDGETRTELGRTQAPKFRTKGAEPRSFLRFAVTGIDRNGRSSAAATVEAASFSSEYRVGTAVLDNGGQSSFDLARGKTVAPEEGDFIITGSAGGASSLGIRGKHGIGSGTPDGFGKFDSAKLRRLRVELRPGEIHTDDRQPETQSFRVRSSEGGYAHVRIAGIEYPNVKFQYVYVAVPGLEEMLRELKAGSKAPSDEEAMAIGKLLEQLDAVAIKDRDAAEEAILSHGAAASHLFEKAALEEEGRLRVAALIRRLWERLPDR